MSKYIKSQISKELLVTIVLLTFYYIAARIPLPYLDIAGFYSFSGQTILFETRGLFSIFSLGILPFISSYVIIEVLSLVVPFLKKYRLGDHRGRIVLKGYALLLTLVIGIIQSVMMIYGFESMNLTSGGQLLTITSLFQYVVLITILVSCLFLLIFMTEIITIYGIGNGLSLLFLTGICTGVFDGINGVVESYSGSHNNAFHEIIFSTFMLFLLISIPMLLVRASSSFPIKHKSLDGEVSFFQMSSCPSGNIAIWISNTLMMFPLTLFYFLGKDDIAANFFPYGSFKFSLIKILLVIYLSYLFAGLFFDLGNRVRKLQSWGWDFIDSSQSTVHELKKKLFTLNMPWTIFLCVMVVLPYISLDFFDQPFFIGGAESFVVGILGLDIFSRINLWKKFGDVRLRKIAEFHDVYYARMIKNHLESENIKFYLQGYYHRHLLYFLGPYIPINLKVAETDIDRAQEVIGKFYGNLGSLKTSEKQEA